MMLISSIYLVISLWASLQLFWHYSILELIHLLVTDDDGLFLFVLLLLVSRPCCMLPYTLQCGLAVF